MSTVSNINQLSNQNELQIKKKKKSHFPFNLFHRHDCDNNSIHEYEQEIISLEINKRRSDGIKTKDEIVNDISKKHHHHRFKHLRHGFLNQSLQYERDPCVKEAKREFFFDYLRPTAINGGVYDNPKFEDTYNNVLLNVSNSGVDSNSMCNNNSLTSNSIGYTCNAFSSNNPSFNSTLNDYGTHSSSTFNSAAFGAFSNTGCSGSNHFSFGGDCGSSFGGGGGGNCGGGGDCGSSFGGGGGGCSSF